MLPLPCQDIGKRNDQRQLGDLRRLETDKAQTDPTGSASPGKSKEEHTQKEQNASSVQELGVTAVQPVGYKAEAIHYRNTHKGKEKLRGKIACRIPRHMVGPGKAGREEHDKTQSR
jgi:hypothetical protein